MAVLVGPASARAVAPADAPVPLDGTMVTLAECRDDSVCIDVGKLLAEYATGDERPDVLRIGIQCSPWRLYDGDGRILTVEALADNLRTLPGYDKVTRLELVCSWSGVQAAGAKASLAARLSAAAGKPTEGYDGFVWIGPNQQLKTTHQSFTAYPGRYRAKRGELVMASAAFAMPLGDPRSSDSGATRSACATSGSSKMSSTWSPTRP